MGKAKKGKKGNKEDDVDDEIVDNQSGIEENPAVKGKDKKAKSKNKDEDTSKVDVIEDLEDEAASKKKKGKKEKKKKKDYGEDDEDVDELTKEIEDVKIEQGKKEKEKKQNKKATPKPTAESSDEEQISVSKPSKNKKKTGFSALADDSDSDNEEDNKLKTAKSSKSRPAGKVKAGFALLEVEGGDSDSAQEDQSKDSDQEENSRNANKKGSKKAAQPVDVDEDNISTKKEEKGGKKGKKQRKKQQDDDEDIEKMLAELELEYSGVKKEVVPEEKPVNEEISEESSKKDKKKKKKDTEKMEAAPEETQEKPKEVIDGEEIEGTVKTAAQKKKEKKEREKQKKMAQKKQDVNKDGSDAQKPEDESTVPTESDLKTETQVTEKKPDAAAGAEEDGGGEGDEGGGEDDDKKKKKKKKKGKEEDDKGKDKGKGPGKKTIAAMQEALKKMREEEERLAIEEAERIKKEEEAERAREEQRQLEIERKERKKLKEKERKERLKAEGKLLTAKQKADRARAQAMLEALKAQGMEMPAAGEKRAPRPGTRVRVKAKKQTSVEQEQKPEEQKVEVQIVDPVQSEKKEGEDVKDSWDQEDDVKDTWDAESSGEDEEEEDHSDKSKADAKAEEPKQEEEDEDDEDNEESESEDESEESSSEEESDSEDEHKTDAERRRERALARIQKRREEAEKNKSLDVLRAAVVCVLGHVDTGKTKILDKLRRTNVQDGEAGGITQQIGATNVPIDAIKEQTKFVKAFADVELRIPGLLIIDTPGHESFSNLRSRGSSLCDIAILVVDIMHGLEPQTIESINLLKNKKTPFIVALNKIDRLYDWQTMNRKDIRDVLKAQAANTQLEFEQRTKEVIVQFAEQGLNASLFFDNPDIRSYVSLVPTSAITGEGMGNLLALIVDSCQNMLAKRLMYSEELQATVLEVKAIPGLGTTIDAILVNGKLREGDTMVLAGTDGPIVTQIRSLLMPQPMKELRVKNAYVEYKEIKAAQGVKIAGKELEKAIAGLNLQVAQKPDEVEILRDEVARELRSALSNIKLQERGVYVQASTLGSLEALLEFLRTSKIPYANIRIGPVVKKDVMKASTMLEHESQYATILAFDVKVERDAQDLADSLGVKIFQADIIYHLFDKFMAYREELKQRKREEFKHIAVFPCKLKVLPQFIFNSRDPIVMGVMIEAGIVKEGTPICVPSREFVDLGVVTSIESNHKTVESARKGQEVCIKIEPIPGEAPKMFGRHFDEKDFLVSKISRQSIDACKDYFRDDLVKTDWQLMVELKKLFQIL
ncbi:eukaryotic translation initiation factor 5B [Periplaneta americana]|uniref:eukaryotic translation initiation factor 5B n=1 Tax=Periplaneta americana TaxID=6978 RepID=UPI0037E77686